MKTPDRAPAQVNWTELIPHRDDVLVEDFELFRDHLVVEERKAGLMQLRIRPWSGKAEHYVDFGEPAYDASAVDNYEADTSVVRYSYSSMTTPESDSAGLVCAETAVSVSATAVESVSTSKCFRKRTKLE